jgi:DNA repair exonuclease SbcCD ATPase subunit
MAKQEQKRRNVFLDDFFPGGLLIIVAVLVVFVLDILSGSKVIGVDQEKVALEKELISLDKEKKDFYRKKKEWDEIEERLTAESAKLKAFKNQSKDETDRRDELQKENKALDETRQELKNNISVLEVRKEDISKEESGLAKSFDDLQQKLRNIKAQNSSLLESNQNLENKSKELEQRNTSLQQEAMVSAGLRNSIKDFVSYVENLKVQADKMAAVSAVSEALDSQQGAEQMSNNATIQDNTGKLLTLSQSLQTALNDILARTDNSKTSNSSENQSTDNAGSAAE